MFPIADSNSEFMILQIATFTIASIFSPLIGLLLAIPFTGNILGMSGKNSYLPPEQEINKNLGKILTIHLLILVILTAIGILNILVAFEILIAVGVTAAVFAYLLYKEKDFVHSILLASLPGFVYIVLKNVFYYEIIKAEIDQANQIFSGSMSSMLSPETMESMQQSLQFMQDLLLQGNVAIWMFSIIAGIIIGALIFSRKSPVLKWDFAQVSFPFYLQLLVAISLLFFIMNLRVYSLNLLAICAYLYLLQGYSVLYFFVRSVLNKNKFLGIGILIIPIFSYFLLISLALIGLVDNWINFRKFAIHKGEN